MTANTRLKIKIQAGVTTVIGLVAIYLIITEPANSDKLKWSYGIIGLILGYWLK
jgi:hypothetical protein